jgi:diguanylate cyclase (GGDEF)-like protein
VLRQATRNLGLALSPADITTSLGAALAAMTGGRESSVHLALSRMHEPDDVTHLCVPVPDAVSAQPLRDIVYTASAADLTALEDELVGLAGQAAIALQRIELTERIRVSEKEQHVLAFRASHDGLTGLANAELFRRELRDASHTVEPGRMTSVLFIDLDDFKNINDTLGHEAGDAVLIATAQRIRTCLREADVGARLGGDEFAVLLRDIADEAAAFIVARRLTAALAQPTMIGDIPVVCRASVGLAVAGETGQYDALLRRADTALYAAKAAGKGRWRQYDPNMRSPLRRGSDLRIELERALRSEPGVADGLAMHYQPIVELTSDRTVGFEALIRWQHPERGTIRVPELIALAEHTGLIVPLGDWVFRSAFGDGLKLTGDGCYVSVNVSVAQLRIPGFIAGIRRHLRNTTIDPQRVVVEITESQLVQDDEKIWDDLADLRTSGVRIAIDDYGTGYASLSYLRHPVIDIVKLDRRFLDDIEADRAQALLRAVLGLTHDLQLPMIAEGIEAESTRAALIKLGCEYGQGHLFAHAMPVDEALNWLTPR